MEKKIDANGYDTDKKKNPYILAYYSKFFEPFLDLDIRLLELGVYRGGSLYLWRDYFPRGLIAGLDINPINCEDTTGRIRVYQGRQEDVSVLDKIAQEVAPQGFDIIIDDCSHIGELTKISFWHLFENHLKPGSIYAIEDWGTGYWDTWPDGKCYVPHKGIQKKNHFSRFQSHDYGMVGFIKQLVDESGYADITCPGLGSGMPRESKFERMHISHGLVIIVKK